MNTVEKPATKNRPSPSDLRRRVLLASCVCNDCPATYETYPGTSGSTQGERKEITPAAKLVSRDSAEMSVMATPVARHSSDARRDGSGSTPRSPADPSQGGRPCGRSLAHPCPPTTSSGYQSRQGGSKRCRMHRHKGRAT